MLWVHSPRDLEMQYIVSGINSLLDWLIKTWT